MLNSHSTSCLRTPRPARESFRSERAFGKALVTLNRDEGAYLSARIKPEAERRSAELHRDLGAVLHAHIARSERMGAIVASHGLTELY